MSLLLLLRLIGSFFYVPRLLGKFICISNLSGIDYQPCSRSWGEFDLTSQIISIYKSAEWIGKSLSTATPLFMNKKGQYVIGASDLHSRGVQHEHSLHMSWNSESYHINNWLVIQFRSELSHTWLMFPEPRHCACQDRIQWKKCYGGKQAKLVSA